MLPQVMYIPSYQARLFKAAIILAYSVGSLVRNPAGARNILTGTFTIYLSKLTQILELRLKLGQPLPFTSLSLHY
jgi:hypothetical protein